MKYYLLWYGEPKDEERAVMRVDWDTRSAEIYDYSTDKWRSSPDTFYDKFLNSNDNDEIEYKEAQAIITKFGGTHFSD